MLTLVALPLFLLGPLQAPRKTAPPTEAAPQEPPARDPTEEELENACKAFANAVPELQAEIVAAIRAAIDATQDPEARKLLELRNRAVRELKPVARPKPEFYDPKVYARGLVRRTAVDPSSFDAGEKRGLYKPWDNQPWYHARVLWDFGRDQAIDHGAALAAADELENALFGCVPAHDLLVAWITRRFDFDDSMNLRADHFAHAYCDLNGRAFMDITLYDAWASGVGIDMPDVDVIAYARRVLKDNSYVSPMPPDARRNALYDAERDGFLAWFRYRTWIEAAANLYVNPAAPLRESHEGLRQRLLYVFALDDGDLGKIATRLERWRTRDRFIEEADTMAKEDRRFDAKAAQFEAKRKEALWAVARATYAALREKGMLAPP